jgi:hypothetical protein
MRSRRDPQNICVPLDQRGKMRLPSHVHARASSTILISRIGASPSQEAAKLPSRTENLIGATVGNFVFPSCRNDQQ